ncbi:MAG TPA: hypothetical protein VF452_18265 [Candidatus Binatia bacterium]
MNRNLFGLFCLKIFSAGGRFSKLPLLHPPPHPSMRALRYSGWPVVLSRRRNRRIKRRWGGQRCGLGRCSVGFIAGTVLLLSNIVLVSAEEPVGTITVTTRMVAPGIGLSWGDGVLTYQGREIPFTFQANGLFRNVDENITAAELSGQVFNLKNAADFAGNYQKVEEKEAENGASSSATMKNEKGVVVNLVSTVAGRKFNLSREGLKVELKAQKPSSEGNSRRRKMLAANTNVEHF